METKLKNMYYPVIIAATHIKELGTIQQSDTGLCVGASVTLATLDQALKQSIQQLDGIVLGCCDILLIKINRK